MQLSNLQHPHTVTKGTLAICFQCEHRGTTSDKRKKMGDDKTLLRDVLAGICLGSSIERSG